MVIQRRRDGPPENQRGRGRIGRPTSTPRPTQSASEPAFPHGNAVADFRQTGNPASGSGGFNGFGGGVEAPTPDLFNIPTESSVSTPCCEHVESGLYCCSCGNCGPDSSGPCFVPCAGFDEEPCCPGSLDRFLPAFPLVYDTGWFSTGSIELRVTFSEGPPNRELCDFLKQLLLSPPAISPCGEDPKCPPGNIEQAQ